MKYLHVFTLIAVVLFTTSNAWGQYGLYGSPEILHLPQAEAAAVPQFSYPSTQAPPYAPAYGPAAYPAAPQYRAAPVAPAYRQPAYAAAPQYRPAPVAPAYGRPDPGYAGPVAQHPPGAPRVVPPPPVPPQVVPTPNQGPSVVDRMLQEAGDPGPTLSWPPEDDYGCSPFGRAVGEPCYGDSAPWVPRFESRWFASVAGLIMTRSNPTRIWTTYETGNEPNQIPTFRPFEWSGGGEVRFGRWFGCECPCEPCEPCDTCDACRAGDACESCDTCNTRGSSCNSPGGYRGGYGGGYGGGSSWGPPGRWGLEATYWTLDAFTGYVARAVPGGSVSTPLIVSDIEFGGVNGTIYFDSAQEHRVWRRDELHNIELNLIRRPVNPGWYGPVGIDWSVGVRYFRFEEDWTFGSLDLGCTWGGNGGLDEAYLRDKAVNHLVGVQMGFNFNWQVGHNLRLFLVPECGIYNNHITNLFEAYRGDGTVANPTAASGMTDTYPVSSSDDLVSFLTQIDLGAEWQFTPRWSAFVGYRVLFATGIALADNQIPTYVVDIPEIAEIDHESNLVLHGAFAGVTFQF